MTIKPLTCTNCAGRINRDTMTCEYCGTKYHFDDGVMMPLRVECQTSPVKILKMETSIPEELLRNDCLARKSVADMAMENIRDQLAKALEDCMEIEMHYDMRQMRQIITARVRVLEPKYRF